MGESRSLGGAYCSIPSLGAAAGTAHARTQHCATVNAAEQVKGQRPQLEDSPQLSEQGDKLLDLRYMYM